MLEENKKQLGEVVEKVVLVPCGLKHCWGPDSGEKQQQQEKEQKQEGDGKEGKKLHEKEKEQQVQQQEQEGEVLRTATEKQGKAACSSNADAKGGLDEQEREEKDNSAVLFRLSAAADVVVMDLFDYRCVRENMSKKETSSGIVKRSLAYPNVLYEYCVSNILAG
jgi:hypothetical protein